MMKDKNAVKSIVLLGTMTFISKCIGLFRDILIAKQFGASYLNDSYIVALTIPNIFFELIGVAIFTTFIPLLNQELYEKGKGAMFEFANNLINILFLCSCVICVLGIMNSRFIIRILAPGFTDNQLNLTSQLLRLSMVIIIFTSMTYGFLAILQTLGNFKLQAFFGVMLSIPIILYIVSITNISIYGLLIATVIGFFLQLIILIPSLLKCGFRYKFTINLSDDKKRLMLKMLIPIIIGSGITQISMVVEKMISTSVGEGYLFCLDLANKLNYITLTIGALPIITVVYSKVSYHINDSHIEELKYYYSKTVIMLTLIMIPSTFLLMFYSVDLVELLFNHGSFTMSNVMITARLLLWLSIGLIFMSYRELCCKVFYSLKDTKTPMINASIGLIILILCSFFTVRYIGIMGVAISSTISIIFTTITIHMRLTKYFENERKLKFPFGKVVTIFTANLLSVAVLYVFSMNASISNTSVSLLVGGVIYILCYSLLLYLLKVNEFILIIKFIIKKLKISIKAISFSQ